MELDNITTTYDISSSSYEDILQGLIKHPVSRDPRSIRLAAVTAALSDVSNNNDNENNSNNISSSNVYAKCITALEGTLNNLENNNSSNNNDSLSTQIALLELLYITIPYVKSIGIISATLPLSSRVLRALIVSTRDVEIVEIKTKNDDGGSGGTNAVLRWTMKVITLLLKRFDNNSVTTVNEKLMKQLFTNTLLELFHHRRPKVRKTAQNGIVELLVMGNEQINHNDNNNYDNNNKCHPIIVKTMNTFIHAELTKASNMIMTDDHHHNNLSELLHLLLFIEKTAIYMNPMKVGESIMEFLISLFHLETTGNVVTTSTSTMVVSDYVTGTTKKKKKVKENNPIIMIMNSLLSIIQSTLVLDYNDNTNNNNDTIKMNQFALRVLASLLQTKPLYVFRHGIADYDILYKSRIIFSEVIIKALNHILDNDNDIDKSCKLLPISIQLILSIIKPNNGNDDNNNHHHDDNTTISDIVIVQLNQLFRTKLGKLLKRTQLDEQQIKTKCIHDLLRCFDVVFDDTYQSTWDNSIKCISILIEQILYKNNIGAANDDDINISIELMIELRNKLSSSKSHQQQQIVVVVEDAMSILIQGIGIENCWTRIKWSKSTTTVATGIDTDRAWILTVMKNAAIVSQPEQPKLSFYQSTILLLARDCDKIAMTNKKNHNLYHTRVIELWSLLPCFCKLPIDMDDILPSLSTTFSKAFEDKRYPQLVPIICHSIIALVNSAIEVEKSDDTKAAVEFGSLSQASLKLLPTMFKFITETHESVSKMQKNSSNKNDEDDAMDTEDKTPPSSSVSDKSMLNYQQLQHVTEAISSLAKYAPTDFLQGMFKKVMHRLLEEIQSDNCDNEKVCSLLSLSQALVASEVLDETNIIFLYRVLKTIIKDDQNGSRVQKRSYKLLAEICQKYHTFVIQPDQLTELVQLLTSTIMTSQIAARHMRLKCMNILVEGMKEADSEQMQEITKVIGEVLLCLKDPNGKTRDAAYQLILSIGNHGDNVIQLIQMIGGALGAQTSHMRSAAVMALSRIVFECTKSNETLPTLLPSILETILVLINEPSREVMKSVIGFIRVSVAAMPIDKLEPLIPVLVGNLLKFQETKGRFRSKIKIILKKLVKLFGYEALMPHVPASDIRLLTHMRKLDEREKRRRIARKDNQVNNGQHDESDNFEQLLDSDEEDSDEGKTLMTGATGLTRQTGRTAGGNSKVTKATIQSKSTAAGSRNVRGRTGIVLPDETDGEVVDMLSAKISKQVQFANNDMDDSDDSDDDGLMEFDDSGRLIVKDDADDEQIRSKAFDDDRGNKRRKLNQSDSGSIVSKDTATSKNQQKNANKKKKNDNDGLGKAFKAKKAGGDIKKKGQQYEPYAFVPLDGRAYSKKNRRTTVEQMATVVRKKGGSGKGGGGGGGKRKR